MKRHELTFEQWSLTEPLLASVAKTGRPPKDRGLRNSRYLITMVYLTAGKLDIELPDLGYTTHTKQRGGGKSRHHPYALIEARHATHSQR